jgi:phosphonate transport system ATP-binding protein
MIHVDKIGIAYSNSDLLFSNLSLTIYEKELTVFLGASGSGKTTLLMALCGLVPLQFGDIVLKDFGSIRDSKNLRNHRLRTGVILQGNELIENQTVLQNVLKGRVPFNSSLCSLLPFKKSDIDIAYECIHRVNLDDKCFKQVRELSGGEKQRVAIAKALAQQPSLIIADEPASNLDPINAHLILSYLERCCSENGTTVMISLHQLDLAKEFGQRIVGLAKGSIVFDSLDGSCEKSILDTIYNSNEL